MPDGLFNSARPGWFATWKLLIVVELFVKYIEGSSCICKRSHIAIAKCISERTVQMWGLERSRKIHGLCRFRTGFVIGYMIYDICGYMYIK